MKRILQTCNGLVVFRDSVYYNNISLWAGCKCVQDDSQLMLSPIIFFNYYAFIHIIIMLFEIFY